MFLVQFLLGLFPIALGFGMLTFGLFGRVPGFRGPSRIVVRDVAAYWQGRLAFLAGGPLMIGAGIFLITFEPGDIKDDSRSDVTMVESGSAAVRSDEEKSLDIEHLRHSLAGVTWESNKREADGGRLTNVTFEFANEAIAGEWAVDSEGQIDTHFTGCTINGQVHHDGVRAFADGRLQCTYDGKTAIGEFEVWIGEDDMPHLVHRWSGSRGSYEFDLVPKPPTEE